ncbi:Ig-like domain repeat protein [Nocardioides sp. BP30]|uniref:Ig-like domain repeat protein n=1 Tax=Nocardioides sp. BP30 TaxID=3036374 RepID=UPI0024697BD2|nr:Ig-like domain-containing protein [Nocardioides sp. BP30]WGL53039.1 Ig-like domain repeat protein [Nocardioides sp. BP30]
MNRPLAAVGVVAGAALALGGLQAVGASTASADPAGTGLVISEVFTGASNSAAPYDADFVELYNPTSAELSLSGLSLQVRRADDSVIGTVALTGGVAAGTHFLVQLDEANDATTSHLDLPTPDAAGSLAMADVQNAAEVVLGNAATYGTGDLSAAPGVTDMVGFAGASSYETHAAELPSTVTTTYNSISRADSGADTNDNSADLTWVGPTPTDAAAPAAARTAPSLSADSTSLLVIAGVSGDSWPTRLGAAYISSKVSGAQGGPTPTGTVRVFGPAGFAANEAPVGNYGTSNLSVLGTAGLAPGTYDLTVVYEGDATYAPATTHASLSLTAGATASTVSASDVTLADGQPYQKTITVAPASGTGDAPTGVVSVWDGGTILTSSYGVALDGGAASVEIPYASLAPGDNRLTVKYSGDDTYAPSSKAITVSTPGIASTTTVTAPATTVGTAGRASVKVAATGASATGEVTLTGAGPAQTKAIGAGGSVTFDLPATLAAGSYTLTASYAGALTDRVLASTGTTTYKVNAVTKPPTGGPHVTGPTQAQKKLAHDQAKLTKTKKAYKKAHGAKKAKLKKKIAKLKKTIKKDKSAVRAGK